MLFDQQNEREARETRIKELEQEMLELKQANEEEDAGTNQDRYDELLKQEPWSFAKAFQEAFEISITDLREIPINEIEELLNYFKGASLSQKKRKFVQFLKELGIYRTKDFKKLRNRFFYLRQQGREALKNNTDDTDFYKYCKELGFKFE